MRKTLPSKPNARHTTTQPIKALYTATVTATGGRDGRAVSADGNLDVKLTTPRELGGQGGNATNPEQLFAAGYSACFIGALKFVASQKKIDRRALHLPAPGRRP